MESIGIILQTLSLTFLELIKWCEIICIVGIVAIVYLLVMDIISPDDIKDFFKK